MWIKNFLTAAALAAGVMGAGRAQGQVVFSEDFQSYADSDALRAAWTGSTETAFNLNNTGYDPAPSSLASQSLSNMGRFTSGHSAFRALSTPIATTTSFRIQVDLLAETYSRSLGFGITNADGTRGYVVRWNNAGVNNNSGRGVVSINEYDDESALTGAVFGTAQNASRPIYATDPETGLPIGSPTGTSTGTSTNAYHPALGYRVINAPSSDTNAATYDATFRGLLTLTLEYTAPATEGGAATLRLFTDGSDNPNPDTVAVLTFTDAAPFTDMTFERFYLIGTSANFDNIVVQAPEPASLGLLAIGGWALVRRRRAID